MGQYGGYDTHVSDEKCEPREVKTPVGAHGRAVGAGNEPRVLTAHTRPLSRRLCF